MKIIEQSVGLSNSNISDEQAVAVIAEAAGHCYGKVTSDQLTLVTKLAKRGHMSPFEHANISLVLATDIATYKQLTRHRHCAFTIESTHFIDYGDGLVVLDPDPILGATNADYRNDLENAIMQIEEIHHRMLKRYGKLIARNLLPQAESAVLTLTTNWRELYHIFDSRKGPENTTNTYLLTHEIMRVLRGAYPMMMSIYDLVVAPAVKTPEDNVV